jgi:ribonuclease Z
MAFELTILGTSSATPTPDRHPSAQYLVFGDQHMLVDCGEGAQIQLMRYGLKTFRISKIFISHLHPDHYLGLPGLLSSLSLKGRTEPLEIYAPKGMQEIIDVQFLYGDVFLTFDIKYHILENDGERQLFKDKYLEVRCFPVVHRIPCWGFLFKEIKLPRKINKDLPVAQKLPVDAYPVLRAGQDYISPEGNIWSYLDYTVPNDPPFSYAYITDSVYLPKLAKALSKYEIDLLYHEATFLNELKEKAVTTFHTTASEAASFAKEANVKKLLIGHFSSRYKDPVVLLNEAREIFPDTELALEGEKFKD